MHDRLASFKSALEDYNKAQEAYSRSLHKTSQAMAMYLTSTNPGNALDDDDSSSNTLIIQFMSALDQVANCLGHSRTDQSLLDDLLGWRDEVRRVCDELSRARRSQVKARSASIDAEVAILLDQLDHQHHHHPSFDRTYRLSESLSRSRSMERLAFGRYEAMLGSFVTDLEALGLRRIQQCSEIIDTSMTEAAFCLDEVTRSAWIHSIGRLPKFGLPSVLPSRMSIRISMGLQQSQSITNHLLKRKVYYKLFVLVCTNLL